MESIIGSEFPKKVIPLIDNARISIDIVVYDWRWYAQDIGAPVQLFNQSIVRAVRRGVVVRAVLNNNQVMAILSGVGVRCKKLDTSRLVHAKIMIIDNDIVITGSHNYTQNAFQTNYELSTILRSPETIGEYTGFFTTLFNQ